MNNNASNGNQNNGSQSNEQVDPNKVKKQQEQEATEELGGMVARGAADYFSGGTYETIRNVPVVGGAAQKVEKVAGKAVGKVANTATAGQAGKVAKGLKDSGALDVADKALGVVGGGAAGAAGGAAGAAGGAAGAAGGAAGAAGGAAGAAGGASGAAGSLPSAQAPKMNPAQQQMTKGAQAGSAGIAPTQGNTSFQDRMNSRNLGQMPVSQGQGEEVAEGAEISEEQKQQLEEKAQALEEQQMAENKQEQEKQEKKEEEAEGTLKGFMKNPLAMFVIFFVAVSIIILFIFIYSMIADMDLVGQKIVNFSDAAPLTNSGQYCTSITLVKETDEYTGDTVGYIDDVDFEETVKVNGKTINRWETEEYQLEVYVKGVLQAEAIDVNDEKTFEVASVAARTYTLEIASPKCRIWNNSNKNAAYRNPQNFTTDTPAKDISKAVSETSGVVMVKNNDLVDMSGGNYYDYFCYTKKDKDKEGIKEFRYIMQQKNEEEVLALPNEWVEKNVPEGDFNRSGKYGNECQPKGMSLFGAKYLLNKESDKYTKIRILHYYYGYDINFKRLVSSGASVGICDGFDLHNTSLSREEFISLVNAHNGGGKYANLAAMAGEIYDLSVANNFNPELVITRAIREGFSGGTNNYWGIAAYNGGGGGSNFSSLSQGVLAFINTMNKYNAATLYDVYNVNHYAYIGKSWIKGNSSDGGCYYFPYIKQYYSDQARAAQVEAACASGNAIATTAEDQSAYSFWQVQKMNESRSEIFGISATCEESDDPEVGTYDGPISKPVSKNCDEMISALFPGGIPRTQAEIAQYQTVVSVPITNKDGSRGVRNLKLHKAIANDVVKALTDAQNAGFVVYDVQSARDWGRCVSSSGGATCGLTMSQHCYGLAVDINVPENPFIHGANPYASSPYAITHNTALYRSFTSLGWGWGGDWRSKQDYMHFSYMGT